VAEKGCRGLLVCSSIHYVRITSIGTKHIGVERMGAGGTCLLGKISAETCLKMDKFGSKSQKSPIAQTTV